MKETFKGKNILITGGCGSIGSEIVRQLTDYDIGKIRVFDHDESAQFHLEEELEGSHNMRYLIGDIRDKDRVKRATRGVDIVFHAAALKHVPLCEYNPLEAVHTNVLGTQNIIDASKEEEVEKLIAISTDKAVNPINTMGATKLLSEKLVINAGFIGEHKTIFSCVRFGNVLNSDGSVIPIFKKQIGKGGPVTVTSKEMTRFFMSMPEAVNLILESAKVMKGREVFILNMKGIRIIDLAEAMIEELAEKPEDIEIKMVGVRPGEKLYELLMTEEEARHVEDKGNMFVLRPGITTPDIVIMDAVGKSDGREYSSKSTTLLTKEEIKRMLHDKDLL